MIVSEKDAIARLESSFNLINRLKATGTVRRDSMGLFGVASRQDNNKLEIKSRNKIAVLPVVVSDFNPFKKSEQSETAKEISLQSKEIKSNEVRQAEVLPPETNLDELLENSDGRIRLSLAHDIALDTLVKSLQMINGRLEEIPAKQLITVASATSKVVNDIRTEQNKSSGTKSVHLHFYSPEQKKISDY